MSTIMGMTKEEFKALEESASGIRLGRSSGFFGAMRKASPEKWEYIVKFPGTTLYQKYQEYIAHVSSLAVEVSRLNYELMEKGLKSTAARECIECGKIHCVEYFYQVTNNVAGNTDPEKIRFPTVLKMEEIIPVMQRVAETDVVPDDNITKISIELGFSKSYLSVIRANQPEKWKYITSYGLPLKEAIEKYFDEVEAEYVTFVDNIHEIRKLGRLNFAAQMLKAKGLIRRKANIIHKERAFMSGKIGSRKVEHKAFMKTRKINAVLEDVINASSKSNIKGGVKK